MSRRKTIVDLNKVESLFNEGYGAIRIAAAIGVGAKVIKRVFKENNLMRKPNEENSINDFWLKIDKSGSNGCWIWLGGYNNKGYGQFSIFGKCHFTHRLAYLLIKGDIPNNLFLCHKCDNPKCCNPDHLFIGDASDNTIDCVLKRRMPTLKLNSDQVIEIRKAISEGSNRKDLASAYNISYNHLLRIINGKKWSFVK